MKFNQKLSEKKWYNGAVVACIGVAFYVLLTHLDVVWAAIRTFVGYFRPVILGVVFAYIINPLAKQFYYGLLKGMKPGKTRRIISIALAFTAMLLAAVLLVVLLVPQLLQSIRMFTANIDSYARTLIEWILNSPLGELVDRASLETISGNALTSITGFMKENAGSILSTAANSGKNIVSIFIGLIISIYLLIDIKNVLAAVRRLFSLLLPKETMEGLMDFCLRCDTILVNYISKTLLDSLIVGIVTAIFLAIFRMPYIGLIAVVVAVTNLIPNFGPVIGGAIGGFILLLVDPYDAVIFLIFCLLLQLVDGYILKPKLFSGALGVSGLVILCSTIVLGNMFGILGILLAIPIAAVLSFLYNDYFLAWRARRRNGRE